MRRIPSFLALVAALTVGVAGVHNVPMAWSEPETQMESVSLGDVGVQGEAAVADFPVSHVGVHWRGDMEADIEVRTAGGSWLQVQHDDPLPDGTNVSGVLPIAGGPETVEVRVVSGDVSNVEVALIDATQGSRKLVPAASPAMNPAASAAVAAPAIISRPQWGANESLRGSAPGFAPVHKFVVHHTVTPNADPNPAATVRAIYAYHTGSNGWSDIGYNYLIDQQGRVYEGRHSRDYGGGVPTADNTSGHGVIGAHTGGYNTGSIGISFLGTYSNATPTAAALGSLNQLIGWQGDRHGVNPMGMVSFSGPRGNHTTSTVVGHRDLGDTDCPGGGLYAKLPVARANAASIIGSARGTTPGYWMGARDGGIFSFGNAPFHGSAGAIPLNQPIVGISRTAGSGYWLAATDGGIFNYNAPFLGSTGAIRLNQPIVGIASTPSGNGYWLVASDGGIFNFGDAKFLGSTGALRLNKPIVGMAPTPSGNGYWLVASDGGIFDFGDAAFHGSTGSLKLNSPITAMAANATGNGYWLVARDGGIFSFNSAFHGAVPALGLTGSVDVIDIERTQNGNGYYVVSSEGSVYTFGFAKFHGARPVLPPLKGAVGIVLVPES